MHSQSGTDIPNISYKLKFENWPKVQHILAYIMGEYLHNGRNYNKSENGLQATIAPKKRKLNLVNFGPQTAKNRTGDSTHPKSTFSDAHIWGAKGRCPLKI